MPGKSLQDFLSQSDLEALYKPSGEAYGLPGHVYTDEEFWELERRQLFAPTWLACAFESDVPNPGDAVPVSVAGWELILTRDPSGKVNVFHNICTHRGMRVLDSRCEDAKTLSCPWHCWTYDLCGELVATPSLGGVNVNEAPGIDRTELGLKKVRSATWLNIVFVNLDGQAPSLETYLEPTLNRLSDYDFSSLKFGGVTTEAVFECNWKLAIEGSLENYHLTWVHPQVGTFKGTYTIETDDGYTGVSFREPYKEGRQTQVEAGGELPMLPRTGADAADNGKSWHGIQLAILPGTILGVTTNHVAAYLFVPVSPTRTEQRRTFLFVGDAATDETLQDARAAVRDAWQLVGDQDADLGVTVQAQQRLRGDLDMPTRFSPYWEPAVHHFQKLVVERLRRADG